MRVCLCVSPIPIPLTLNSTPPHHPPAPIHPSPFSVPLTAPSLLKGSDILAWIRGRHTGREEALGR